jgi:hypothetical protein
MPLHLIKLCVGVDNVDELARWQKKRLADQRAKGVKKPMLRHVTRNTPKRGAEIIDGGSLYWVIKGVVRVRQRIVEMKPIRWEGKPHCALILDRKLVRVVPRGMRAFQGWRYLEATNAPLDLGARNDGLVKMPPKMIDALRELGLL